MITKSGDVWVMSGYVETRKTTTPSIVLDELLEVAVDLDWKNLPSKEELEEYFFSLDLDWTFGDADDTLVNLYDFLYVAYHRALKDCVEPEDQGRELVINCDTDTYVCLGS